MTPDSRSDARSDETEQQGAERGLDRMARAAMDEMPALVAVLDRQGRVVFASRAWSAAAAAASSLPLALAEGSDYPAAWSAAADSGEEARQAADGLRSVLHGGHAAFAQDLPCRIWGEERWFSMRVTRSHGACRGGVVVACEDITERRRREEALCRRVDDLAQAARRLEQQNAEADQFAYIISHDLKAPLRGIANLSRWIEEDADGGLNAAVREHLDMMHGRVHRMEAMIEGLLQYSRVDRAEVRPQTVDVGALLAGVVERLDLPPGFEVEIGGGMPAMLAERVRLEQVFLNLLGNAVKHHHDPAHGLASVSVRDLGEQYEFTVCDNGPGMAPEYHEKVFVIFQTLQARDQKEGAGVGLSLVRKIVQTQGGTIRLSSDTGQGSSFCFTWPKRAPQ